MSLTITGSANQRIATMNPRARMYWGFGAFTTTGTTVEVYSPFKKIEAVFVFPMGTPNANEPLSVDETVTNDAMARPAGGSITVTRAAGTTSGLKFAFLIIGE